LTAFIWLISIVAALFIQDDVVIHANQVQENRPASIPTPLSRALWMLILVNILVAITRFGTGFAQPLIMNKLNFDASAISSATAVSGLIALPLPFLVGWLSDRIGRRQLLIASYILTLLGAVLLISALDLWNFWLSSSFMTLAAGTTGVANAFVADMAPPEALSTAMARFSATPWIAGIIGYGATGFIIQGLGPTVTLLLGATLPIVAIIIMLMNVPRDVQVAAS
jgi:DHA1 family tetracycline resistance protein-like MFS transporter